MAERYAPTVLPDGFGVTVYGADCGLLAGAVALLTDIQAGKVPPGSARRYEASARLLALRDILASAAKDQEAAKHREIARLAQSQPSTTPVFLAPAQPSGSSVAATITAQQAAEQLGVTGQRIRDLCATGRLAATYGPHKVWQIDPESVADYATRRRRTAAHGQDDRGTAGEPRAAA